MAAQHGKDAAVAVGGNELTRYFNSFTADSSRNSQQTTTFQPPGDTHEYVAGIRDATLSLSGMFTSDGGSSGSVDQVLHAAIQGDADGRKVAAAPAKFAAGSEVRFGEAYETSYSVTTPTDGVIECSAEWQFDGGPRRGLALVDLAERTSDGNGPSQDLGAGSGDVTAQIHVVSAGGTSPTVDAVVQHSADDSTWVDLLTLPQVAGQGAANAEVRGQSVERYVRATWTLGGTSPQVKFVVCYRRHNQS